MGEVLGLSFGEVSIYDNLISRVGFTCFCSLEKFQENTEGESSMPGSSEEAPVLGRDVAGRIIMDFSKTTWWGLPREEIPWYPRINYEKCVGCGLCFWICSKRVVYDWDFEKNKPVVARPYNCMVGCVTCANLCPGNAIVFPSLEELKKWRDKAKAVNKAKEKIEELRKKIGYKNTMQK